MVIRRVHAGAESQGGRRPVVPGHLVETDGTTSERIIVADFPQAGAVASWGPLLESVRAVTNTENRTTEFQWRVALQVSFDGRTWGPGDAYWRMCVRGCERDAGQRPVQQPGVVRGAAPSAPHHGEERAGRQSRERQRRRGPAPRVPDLTVLTYALLRNLTVSDEVIRGFAHSLPVAWTDIVADGASLPIVLFLHLGNAVATEFLATMEVTASFRDDSFVGVPLKYCAIAPQAAGSQVWQSDHLGPEVRQVGIEDIDFRIDVPPRLEALLQADYLRLKGEVAPRAILDMARIYLVGMSSGGQMALKLASAPPTGWTIKAVVAISTTIGGWLSVTDKDGGAVPSIVFLPDVSMLPHVLILHGKADTKYAAAWNTDGVAIQTSDVVEHQVVSGNENDYMRWDYSAVSAFTEISAAYESVLGRPPDAPYSEVPKDLDPVMPSPTSRSEWAGGPVVHFHAFTGLVHTFVPREAGVLYHFLHVVAGL